MLSEILPVFVVIAAIRTCTGESAFVCTEKGSGKQTIKLHCPYGTEIQIKESVYGRNKWRQCLYTVGDCTEPADISRQCCGRRNCDVTIWRIYSIKCEYVTFFRVIYECVERGDAECEHDEEPETYEPDIFDITSHARFPLTSANLYPIKSTVQNQVTPNNHFTDSMQSGPALTDPAMSNSFQEEEVNDDLTLIVLSAVSIAVLLVCIIVVVFVLRKFKWQGEKACILSMFVGWCKRHPPDGCENPDAERSSTSRDVRFTTNGNDVNRQNFENLNIDKVASSLSRVVPRDVNHNNESDGGQGESPDTSSDNHYVVFEDIKTEPTGKPVLPSRTAGRVVLDQKAYNCTPVVSEGPGTTAV